ncbi:MAG TPA: glycosyltransferase family 39 protein [Gaiella sp.]|nr:glycosyltransferase family 39 protein [Gaiella sp.]
MLIAEGALLAWNAWHYDWLRGYDAFANEQYADVVSREYRLPSVGESGVWHTPPLWFALAGTLGRLTTVLGLGHAQRPGQLLAAAAGLVTCILVFLLARVLFPERRVLHLVSLVLVAASPALVRASAMYHPETLAVALATGGVLVAARALRTRWTLGSAVAAGALLGLACLTRAWAVPVLVAVLVVAGLNAWDTRRWAPFAACGAVSLALLAPWLVNQELAHGSALAFNRPPPSGSMLDRRPASFYLGPRSLRALEHPVTPLFRNELVPHLYADWWGDWALTWDSPPPPAPAALLPSGIVSERARQAFIGVLPSLLALAGLIALGLLSGARRSASLALLPLSAVGVVTAYVVFAVRYPSTDGDTIKATYLLMALPAAALGAAFVIDALRPRGRVWATAGVVALGALVAVQLPFLIL